MATILQPIDFTDVDSKGCVSGDNSNYYKPFAASSVSIVATKGDILTGVTSGAKIKVLVNITTDDVEIFAKVIQGDPEEAGEVWQNAALATVFTGSGGIDEGRNVYLNIGDDYLGKLYRDFGIDPTDTDLVSPPIFQVKEVLICFVEIKIFQDLLQDSRAPFEGQEVLTDKYINKLKEAKSCHDKWLGQLDENAFYDLPKGTDSPCVRMFNRA
jgi:hypothetical protein